MRYKVEYKVIGGGSISHTSRVLELQRPSESEAIEALRKSGAINSNMASRTEIKSITPA